MPSLKERFEAFVQTLEGFESIDYLLMGNDYAGKQRADYLLNGRTIIIEQKSLEQNPTDKPQKFVERLANEQGFLIYGQVSTNLIFGRMGLTRIAGAPGSH
jgi:hypothetical protein